MSTWKQFVANGDISPHATSKKEVANLLAVVKRDLRDASIAGLSADRQFATAYNAALQLCKIAIGCCGYRVAAKDHHKKSFEIAEFALGKSSKPLTDYFELCRRKRNKLDYDLANVVTNSEAAELIKKTSEFQTLVMAWLQSNHANLVP